MADSDLTGIFHLGRVVRGLMQIHDRALAAAGIDLTAQQLLLLTIVAAARPTQINHVADAIGVDPSTTTRMIDRLEVKGLLSRTSSPTDRRVTLIDLTPEADDVLARAVAVARRVKHSLFAGIDRADLERFGRVLADLDANVAAVAQRTLEAE